MGGKGRGQSKYVGAEGNVCKAIFLQELGDN